jgi:REP element-mobilizing transposase RayT
VLARYYIDHATEAEAATLTGGARAATRTLGGETHLMAAFRYIALNPVKAKLDATPTDWPWYGTAAAPRRWLGD